MAILCSPGARERRFVRLKLAGSGSVPAEALRGARGAHRCGFPGTWTVDAPQAKVMARALNPTKRS